MISSKTVITNRKKGRIIALLLIAFALITLLFKLTSVSFASTTPPLYGQADYTHGSSNRGGSAAADTLSGAGGIVVTSSGTYISDSGNNRVLFYPTGSTTATRVYGQADMSGTSSGSGATNLNSPKGIAVDSRPAVSMWLTTLTAGCYTSPRLPLVVTLPPGRMGRLALQPLGLAVMITSILKSE